MVKPVAGTHDETPDDTGALVRMITPSAPAPDRFYRPELDVLRFGAFALVFLAHVLPPPGWLSAASIPYPAWGPLMGLREGGGYGVDLFFLLSAYLITEILLREYRRTSTIDVRAFWIRRILRIWPLYFGFLALALFVVPLFYPQKFPLFHAVAYATFWGNYSLIISPDNFTSVAGILWSVSIEEQFYLVWPILLLACMPWIRTVCIGLILVSTCIRGYLVWTGVDSLWSFWSNTLVRLEPIAVGALIAISLDGRTPKLRESARALAIVSGLALIVLCGMYFPKVGPTALVAYPLATAAAALLLVGTLGTHFPLPPYLVYLGRISYGLYVFHSLALLMARTHVPYDNSLVGWAAHALVAASLTVLFAAISYRWYELPFLRLKRRFSWTARLTPNVQGASRVLER